VFLFEILFLSLCASLALLLSVSLSSSTLHIYLTHALTHIMYMHLLSHRYLIQTSLASNLPSRTLMRNSRLTMQIIQRQLECGMRRVSIEMVSIKMVLIKMVSIKRF
jgi:hypothetical protein